MGTRSSSGASASSEKSPLEGLRVLIVEDEALIAMMIEEYLKESGCQIAFSARRLEKAMAYIKSEECDAAILDVNIAGESVAPLAEVLAEKAVPFIFATGYGLQGVDQKWAHHPLLQKPFTAKELQVALLAALARVPK